MKADQWREIRAVIGEKLPPMLYRQDAWALHLLRWKYGEADSLKEIRRSPQAGWLQKPLLRTYLAQHTHFSESAITNFLCRQTLFFRRALQTWASPKQYHWAQTSRPGMSLVVRLDLGHEHDVCFPHLGISPEVNWVTTHAHMPQRTGHNLAWVRMDFDLDTGEVLIEEVQNDWLRLVDRTLLNLKHGCYPGWSRQNTERRLKRYDAEMLQPLRKIWAEAALFSALDFIRHELGLHTVYMHTPEDGARIKGITAQKPPVSLYTDLPRRFGFTQVQECPQFLHDSWDKMPREWNREVRERGLQHRNFTFWKMTL